MLKLSDRRTDIAKWFRSDLSNAQTQDNFYSW